MSKERCEYYKICTTDCDCTPEDTECCSLYELHDKFKRLEQKYNEVLKLAKQNADSNEYCIQELEKENEELKSLLDFEVQKAETYQQKNEDLKEKLGNTEVLLANAESDLKFEEERTKQRRKRKSIK